MSTLDAAIGSELLPCREYRSVECRMSACLYVAHNTELCFTTLQHIRWLSAGLYLHFSTPVNSPFLSLLFTLCWTHILPALLKGNCRNRQENRKF